MAKESVTFAPPHSRHTAPVTLPIALVGAPATVGIAPERKIRVLAAPRMAPAYRIAKRLTDIALSLTALILVSPLLLLAAVLIWATSRGPVLFRQQRVGEGGRIFTIYKFRSMYTNADHTLHRLAYMHFLEGKGGNGKVSRETLALIGHSHPDADPSAQDAAANQDGVCERWTQVTGELRHPARWLRGVAYRVGAKLTHEDPRVTPIGAIIRATSIDELPQLFNVLKGDMSLVGPRPPIPYEVRLYQPRHLSRLTVRPGITGIWQVHGRNRVTFEEMIDMDVEYILGRSYWLDLKLMLLTVPSVLLSRAK
jgi:lipopolysaccharide/colanic/teichoic acid biosynthesis glycosyltransferase